MGQTRTLSGEAPRIPRPRIQGLSDLIFGLALSIGAIQLIGSVPNNVGALDADIVAFGFSFLILINIWNRYTTLTSVMPVETPILVRMNMLLLFLVAIEPFLFNLLVVQGLGTSLATGVSEYYALDIGMMNLVLAYFAHTLTIEERKLIPPEMIGGYIVTRNLLVATGAIFFVSILPFFWALAIGGLPLRIVLWVVTVPIIWAGRLIKRAQSKAV
jgi:Endosomal/lysosomal potassium channel TMEM175